MRLPYPSRTLLPVACFVLVLAGCSSSSKKTLADAQPGPAPSTDGSVANPLDAPDIDIDSGPIDTSGVDGNTEPRPFTVTPASIALGTLTLGVAPPSQTITVTAKAAISDLTVSPLGDGLSLGAASTCTAVLVAGASCRLVVDYLPASLGDKNVSIVIVAGSETVVVPVTATVVTDLVATIFPNTPQTIRKCERWPADPVIFQLANVGDSMAVPVTVEITGPDAASFQAGTSGCDSIPPGGTCVISVVFEPVSCCRTSIATLVVTDTRNGRAVAVPLTGEIWSCGDALSLTSATIDFGSVPVGMTGPPITFTLRHWGGEATGPLVLSAVSPGFSIANDGCSGVSISEGESCTFDLLFTPTSVGPKMATVVVMPTNPRVNMIVKDTSGKGIAPVLDGGIQDSASPG